MNSIPEIFVIIVTYKGMRWYDKCFSSLRESTLPVHTIVVDNTPGEKDANYIRERYPEIHLIKTEENLGFGKANNLGMRYALDQGCDYVFLLNQDAWLIDFDIFSMLIEIAEQHKEYGIISPMHVFPDGKTINMVLENATNKTSIALLTDLYKNNLKRIYNTNYINAAAWLLPRKTLEIIGGFDPIFTHYGEDDNYIDRIKFHGLGICLVPSIRIVHDTGTIELPFTDNKLQYFHQQQLLVNLTNICDDISPMSYIRYCLRKCLISSLSGKYPRKYLNDIKYIYSKKSEIIRSRSVNVLTGESWL